MTPVATSFKGEEQRDEGLQSLAGESGNGSGSQAVSSLTGVGGEREGRGADVVLKQVVQIAGIVPKLRRSVLQGFLPKGGPVFRLLVHDGLVGERDVDKGRKRLVELVLLRAGVRAVLGLATFLPRAGGNSRWRPASETLHPSVRQAIGDSLTPVERGRSYRTPPLGSVEHQGGAFDLPGFGASHIGEGSSGEALLGSHSSPESADPTADGGEVLPLQAGRQPVVGVEHIARDVADSLVLVILGVGVTEHDAADMSGFMLKAPPHSGKAGAGPRVRSHIRGANSVAGELPLELRSSEVQVGTGKVGELEPRVGVPLGHGTADVSVQKAVHVVVRRGGCGGASGEVSRHLGRLEELPNLVSEGVAFDKEPRREVREEPRIFKPLDTRNGR